MQLKNLKNAYHYMQLFVKSRRSRDLVFCLKLPLAPYHVCRKRRLRADCAGLPEPLLFPYVVNTFLARLYVSTGRAIAVTTASLSASALASTSASALLKMLKFLKA